VDQLFKATTETLRLLSVDDDPNDDIVMALRKIEGRLHHLMEEKEHLTTHFHRHATKDADLVPIDVFIKQKAEAQKQERLVQKKLAEEQRLTELKALKKKQAEERAAANMMLACRPIKYRSKKVDFKPEEESSEELDEEAANQKLYLDHDTYKYLQEAEAARQEREHQMRLAAASE
jgi:hypothetical protein